MAGASSQLLIFFPGGGVPEGRVYGRRLVFVSVRTNKRHPHFGAALGLDHVAAHARWGSGTVAHARSVQDLPDSRAQNGSGRGER